MNMAQATHSKATIMETSRTPCFPLLSIDLRQVEVGHYSPDRHLIMTHSHFNQCNTSRQQTIAQLWLQIQEFKLCTVTKNNSSRLKLMVQAQCVSLKMLQTTNFSCPKTLKSHKLRRKAKDACPHLCERMV